jgi:diguanylate cyclase (GGDEF)-like protein/PAS domain S-box-containing protein
MEAGVDSFSPGDLYQEGKAIILNFVIISTVVILAIVAADCFFLRRYHRIKQLGKQSEQRYHTLVQNAFDGILLIDEKSNLILEDNSAFLTLLGRDEKDRTTGSPLTALLFDRGEDFDISTLVGLKRELQFRRKDGSALEAEVSAVRIPSGERSTFFLIIYDLTERKALEQSLLHEATHDHLTGLPNRRFFEKRLQQEISYHRRKQKTLAVMLLDLDNFKQVNDTLGHRAGDALLRDFAQLLRKALREYDLVARFGGDEFLIGLVDVESLENVACVARKLLEIFNAPFRVESYCVDYVTGSMGIAIYPEDGENAERLLACADSALYESKRNGKRGFSFYQADSPG